MVQNTSLLQRLENTGSNTCKPLRNLYLYERKMRIVADENFHNGKKIKSKKMKQTLNLFWNFDIAEKLFCDFSAQDFECNIMN